jgi:hypothetical protein
VEVETQIQLSVNELVESHRKWKLRRIVQETEDMELKGELLQVNSTGPDTTPTTFPVDMSSILPTANASPSEPTAPPLRFLQYPRATLTNRFYANLLNHYRSIEIYLTLIPRPVWGTLEPWRFQCAIDLCRTHAALGEERNFLTTGKIWGLWLCGITFGGPELFPVLHNTFPCSFRCRRGVYLRLTAVEGIAMGVGSVGGYRDILLCSVHHGQEFTHYVGVKG